MADKLQSYSDKAVAKSQRPVQKLFRHHLGEMENQKQERAANYQAVQNAGEKIDRFMDKFARKLFSGIFESA